MPTSWRLYAVATMEPGASDTRFNNWYQTLGDRQHHVDDVGTVVIEAVRAARLDAFLRARDADPTFRAFVGRPLRVVRDDRSQYCLLSAAAGADDDPTENRMSMEQDWCDPSAGIGTIEAPLLQAATDTGELLLYSYPEQETSVLVAPFYRPGASLATVAQRRAAIAGWVSSSLDLPALIRASLGGEKGLEVSVYHRNAEQLVTQFGQPALHSDKAPLVAHAGSSGSLPAAELYRHNELQLLAEAGPTPGRNAVTLATPESIDGSWVIRVRGNAPAGGLSPGQQAAVIASAGVLMSVLMFLLVFVLAHSRARALDMVTQKTRELRHQAMHDAVTGLPNRVLAIDHAERMLARARRDGHRTAALYIDLDGFIHVNDTLGHAAGDQLLRLVADRLRAVVRESDTAARLGGDEFVVLLHGSESDVKPELVAERLLRTLCERYDLPTDRAAPLPVTASIGIAYGVEQSAEELLAAADVAMYAAKTAGKAGYVVFQPGMMQTASSRAHTETRATVPLVA
jgi:diguanylate cyclase (GGDEF)-like protein